MSKPGDPRIIVKQIGARLNVNIAGLGAATTVNCAVRVDVDDGDHELFNESWNSTGSKLAATRLTSGTLFDLLTDGLAHMFYFLFWADVDNQVTIDVVELWEAPAHHDTSGPPAEASRIIHKGLVSLYGDVRKIGTGSSFMQLSHSSEVNNYFVQSQSSGVTYWSLGCVLSDGQLSVCARPTVSGDICYINKITVIAKSEQ